MQAIIMAGGKGTQLYPLTTSITKPMLPLFDRPAMEHCIRLLARQGIGDIIVTLSFLARDIIEYFGNGSRFGVRIRYSVETEPRGTAGGVKLVQHMIDDTFVVISGDAVTDIDLSEAIQRHRSASASATILYDEVDDPTQFGSVECDSAGKVTRFVEKPRSTEAKCGTVSTGIYVMEPDALDGMPSDRPWDFARDVFPRMLSNGDPLYAARIPGYWCDIGNVAQYRAVHFDALEGRLKLELPAVHIGQGVWLGERVDVHSSVDVSSPVYLGTGAVVRRNATLGARTVVGSDALVDEGARISRSVIGTQSVVGRNTSVTDCIVGGASSVSDGANAIEQTLTAPVHYETPEIVRVRVPKPVKPNLVEAREEAATELNPL